METMKPHLQGWNEDQNRSHNGNCQEEPQEDAVKNLGHKFPVLHDLQKRKGHLSFKRLSAASELIQGCETSNVGFGTRFKAFKIYMYIINSVGLDSIQ